MEHIADLPSLLPPSERTLSRMLRRQATLYGERRLVEIDGQVWSFADALDMAARFGGTLRAAGIERGDHVAVMCGNRAELLQVYLGCGWIGAVTVPINTASRGMQLAHILANSQAKLLVLQSELAPALDGLDSVPPSLRAIWLIGDADVSKRWPRASGFPVPGQAVPEVGDRTRRYRGNPLHLGHNGCVERRVLSARAVLLVGGEYRVVAGLDRR